MALRVVIEECRLCGIVKPLSFEHVPPRSAFNNVPRFYPVASEFISNRYRGGPAPTMIREPRGAGAYTLCVECNTKRCARYAQHFVEWAVSWQVALDLDVTATSIPASLVTRRSRVMKQIIAMMLSASPPAVGRINDGLRRFGWNAEEKGLPDGIRLFTALTREKDARQAGGAGKIDVKSGGTGSVFSEVAFAPMILVMTLGNTAAPDSRLVDI